MAAQPALRITAEPLTPEAYRPFGVIIDPGRAQLHCADGQYFVERLTLNPLNGPMRRINRHFDCSQLFVPIQREPILIVVAPPWLSGTGFDARQVRAFISDGRQAFTFDLGTWHIGPRSLSGKPLTLINVQGQRSNEVHTEEIDLLERAGMVVEFHLP